MNSCEAVFWSSCLFAILMLARHASPARWWTIFGLSAGIGLLNKPSMAFFLAALALALLLSSQRRLLFTRWAALGIALAILITLPYLHWQIHNHWPTVEFLHNGRAGGKNTVLNPLALFPRAVLRHGSVERPALDHRRRRSAARKIHPRRTLAGPPVRHLLRPHVRHARQGLLPRRHLSCLLRRRRDRMGASLRLHDRSRPFQRRAAARSPSPSTSRCSC